MRLTSLSLFVLLGLASTQLSCGEAFAPYWRIDKLRVLAIKADPITLKPGQRATISALVYSPDPEPITYAWEWCPFRTSPQNEYACPFTREELAEQLRANLPPDAPNINLLALIPDFDLGQDPTGRLVYPATQEIVLGLCQALQGFLATQDEALAEQIGVTNCERGYDVSLRLIVTQGDERRIAAKRINLWTGSEFDQNTNPSVTGVQVRLLNPSDAPRVKDRMPWVKDGAPRDQQWHLLPEDEATPILANIPLEIRSVVDPDRIDVWQPPAPQGSVEPRLPPEKEVILFRWFTTGGELDNSNRIWRDGLNALDDASLTEFEVTYRINTPEGDLDKPERKNDWDLDGVPNAQDNCPYVANPEQREDACTLRLWSVIRDGRLGIDWVERRLEVVGHVL